ncbi:cytochrome b/b6 domain-containing protein [Massilia horti]|uniref:Cytochrome B n=1 Tax=Massilia horti TaxID=2562153 RepID=A0A4Y9SQU7_9BURK|nr:cytochrome b/b6 domain-containing protein [Massilia horti]TFW29152.1 cytochrome B [Massilia horti]
MSKNKRRAVWDLPVRSLHWLLVAGIAGAWITSSEIGEAHEYFGYAVVAIVAMRFALGFAGTRYARFSQFVRSPKQTLRYLSDVRAGRAPRYLGHNPLGGWMVVTLLLSIALVTLTGWVATTDAFWGYAWPVRIHVAIAWMLVLLIALHVSGVVLTSWQHRENLVGAMITGMKDNAQPGDID